MPDITIRASDGARFGAYLAMPATGAGPGLIVIQEIFGVNAVMRDLCDGFAKLGYFACCPDLFWRQEPGVQLTDKSKEEWDRALKLMNGFDYAAGIGDLIATLDHLRGLDECSGKIGAVGYCLGGSLAFAMACLTSVDAAIGYYPVEILDSLANATGIKKPLMLHIAEQDGFCPPEAQAKIKDALGGNPLIALHSYAGADHAFARRGGEHYDESAAAEADGRSVRFLKTCLS